MEMTMGDYVRHMTYAQLANILIDTIVANSDYFEEYRIDLGGYFSFNVIDAEDLTEKLGEVVIEDGTNSD
jgi:hypothetical protein